MVLHYSAYLPLLCFDENIIHSFVEYLQRCENAPNPEEVSELTGLPIDICKERIQWILFLDSYIRRNRDQKFHVVRRRKLKDFLE